MFSISAEIQIILICAEVYCENINTSQIGIGVMFIVTSLLCRHGAEITCKDCEKTA